MSTLEKTIAKAEEVIAEAKVQLETGNKTAGKRARLASIELGKLLPTFRKESVRFVK